MFRLNPIQLAHWSRDRQFLLRAAAFLTVGSVVIAFIVSLCSPLSSGKEAEIAMIKSIINGEETGKTLSRNEWITFLRTGSRSGPVPRDCRGIVTRLHTVPSEPNEFENLSEQEAEPLALYERGLRLGEPDTAITGLKSLPAGLRYRNEFLGDLCFLSGDLDRARSHYLEEASQHSDTRYSRRSAVVMAWRLVDRKMMKTLLADPSFRNEFSPGEQLHLFTDARDFRGLAGAVYRYETIQFRSPGFLPAVFTAAIWFLILMPFWQVTKQRLAVSALAFTAGILSAAATIFAVLIQERIQGFHHNPVDSPLNQFIYFVAGVSLREETLKLLFFVPFAIWSAHRKSMLEALILASLVGLGFAFKENISYFESGIVSFTAWMRFLTANVLHFSLTGISGYYLARMIRYKFHGMETFLFSFIAVVLAHGVYNSIIAIPSLSSYEPLTTIFVAAMAYQFFDPLRDNMDTYGIRQRISPLGVFVLGASLLACGLMITTSWVTPFRFALGIFASSVASLIPLAFAYISRFRDL
ncbi:MAG: PrsW family glutamic-type intramembrane protease [Verrucomicrobiales bacterium]|nr:PrsW family glutamic-type intramembrane protease [Verrucomicrobiales bacterium]